MDHSSQLCTNQQELDAVISRCKEPITGIYVPGKTRNIAVHENNPELSIAFRRAGIGYEPNRNRPWDYQTMIPRAVKTAEPLVIVFRDGTALELRPEGESGIRIQIDQSRNKQEAASLGDYDVFSLFHSLADGCIESIEEDRTTRFFNDEEVWSWSVWKIWVSNGWSLYLQQNPEQEYTAILLFELGSRKDLISRGEALRLYRMPDGDGCEYKDESGEEFWIRPVKSIPKTSGRSEMATDEDISLGGMYLWDYLIPFLDKYIGWGDPYQSNLDGFDLYENNYYTTEAIEAMLWEIEAVIQNLRANPLAKKMWHREKTLDPTDAIAFYERFLHHMRSLEKQIPDDGGIVIYGW